MKTLIIACQIDKAIADMQLELENTNGIEKETLLYKIKLAESYRDRHRLDLKMREITEQKIADPELYESLMKELVKDIPGISYSKRGDNFCVRVSRRGNRVYLGAFKRISEAVDILNYYTKTLSHGI